MKKIFLIFFVLVILLFLPGCSDYKELNSLSYITGMGFDYENGTYTVTYEVMDNKKDGQSVITNTYVVTGQGESTYEAHVDAASKLNKTAYYLHCQVFIITENIAEEKLLDIMDSIIRNPKLNEEFLLVLTKENTPEEIFSSTTDAWPSVAFYINNLVLDNQYSMNYYINMPFAVFTEKINADNIDPLVSVITLDENEIILTESILFSEYKASGTLTKEQSNLYNALTSDDKTIPITLDYEDASIEVSCKFSSVEYKITKDTIYINIEALSEIKKSDSNIDLFTDSIYDEIGEKIGEEINKIVNELITTLQENKSDILGFSNYYYIDTREDNNYAWTSANINIEITSSISRKGIIYNVG